MSYSPGRLFLGIAFAAILAPIAAATSHAGNRREQSGDARGNLTVTATVVSSAQVIVDADGKQHPEIANAPDVSGKESSGQKYQPAHTPKSLEKEPDPSRR